MTNHHPITPPPELIGHWIQEWINTHGPDKEGIDYVVVQAAQYGADQELEACKQWLSLRGHAELAIKLGYCMRNKPEPPSLKEQALEELEQLKGDANSMGMGFDAPAIRRALETLPE